MTVEIASRILTRSSINNYGLLHSLGRDQSLTYGINQFLVFNSQNFFGNKTKSLAHEILSKCNNNSRLFNRCKWCTMLRNTIYCKFFQRFNSFNIILPFLRIGQINNSIFTKSTTKTFNRIWILFSPTEFFVILCNRTSKEIKQILAEIVWSALFH